jgi:hypothetical protein
MYQLTNIFTDIPFFMQNKQGINLKSNITSQFDCSNIIDWIRNDYRYGSGALFIVRKDLITQHPKEL